RPDHVLRGRPQRVHGGADHGAHAAPLPTERSRGMTTDPVPATDRRLAEGLLPGEPLAITPSALETLTRSELDVQITTARRYPRSLARFKAAALMMIRMDQATAAACFYALPRRERREDGSFQKKTITGPSVRLAEIVASCWGNLRAGARVIAETDREI